MHYDTSELAGRCDGVNVIDVYVFTCLCCVLAWARDEKRSWWPAEPCTRARAERSWLSLGYVPVLHIYIVSFTLTEHWDVM